MKTIVFTFSISAALLTGAGDVGHKQSPGDLRRM